MITLKKVDLKDFPEPFTWTRSTEGHVFICGDIIYATVMIRGVPGHDWRIASDGTVAPSINIACGPNMKHNWHENVKLEDWTP